jgi:hypothetical protein
LGIHTNLLIRAGYANTRRPRYYIYDPGEGFEYKTRHTYAFGVGFLYRHVGIDFGLIGDNVKSLMEEYNINVKTSTLTWTASAGVSF